MQFLRLCSIYENVYVQISVCFNKKKKAQNMHNTHILK